MPISHDADAPDDSPADHGQPISDFGLADHDRALWDLTKHDREQVALSRSDQPHAVQVTHQSDGWLCVLYNDDGAPVPIAYRAGVATVDVHETVLELVDEAETLRPPDLEAF